MKKSVFLYLVAAIVALAIAVYAGMIIAKRGRLTTVDRIVEHRIVDGEERIITYELGGGLIERLVPQRLGPRGAGPGGAGLLEKKKKEFLNIAAISFLYVDTKAIRDFYNMTFKEPTTESEIEKLIAKEAGVIESGSAAAPVLKSKITGEAIREYVKNIRLPETTEPEMFLRYQRHILEKDKVRYGFDEIDIRLEEIDKFEGDITELAKKYQVSIPSEFKERKKTEIRKRLVDAVLGELEKVDQFVLLAGKYKITKEKESIYRLTYEHPINQYLGDQPGAKIYISLLLDRENVDKAHVSQLDQMASQESKVSIHIFGKVLKSIDGKAKNWELVVVPLAVY